MATAPAETIGDESERVRAWRLHVLLEAGYPVHLAEQVASSAADLHHAVELVANGCEVETAAAILT
jgi:hypothetical protein